MHQVHWEDELCIWQCLYSIYSVDYFVLRSLLFFAACSGPGRLDKGGYFPYSMTYTYIHKIYLLVMILPHNNTTTINNNNNNKEVQKFNASF